MDEELVEIIKQCGGDTNALLKKADELERMADVFYDESDSLLCEADDLEEKADLYSRRAEQIRESVEQIRSSEDLGDELVRIAAFWQSVNDPNQLRLAI